MSNNDNNGDVVAIMVATQADVNDSDEDKGNSIGWDGTGHTSVVYDWIRTFFRELVLESVGEDPLKPGLGIPNPSSLVRDFLRLDLKGPLVGVVDTTVEMVDTDEKSETDEPLTVEPAGEVVTEFTLPFQEESKSFEKGRPFLCRLDEDLELNDALFECLLFGGVRLRPLPPWGLCPTWLLWLLLNLTDDTEYGTPEEWVIEIVPFVARSL